MCSKNWSKFVSLEPLKLKPKPKPESGTTEQYDFDKDQEVEDNDEKEDEQQAPVIIVVVDDEAFYYYCCLGFLPPFLSSTISRKVYCFLDLIFFFLVSFFGFGYLIFKFDFLGCGLMTDVLGFNLIQWV